MSSHALKDAAVDFLKLVASGRVAEGYDRHVGAGFRHHNPYFRGDAEPLKNAMQEDANKNPNKSVTIHRVWQDGNEVVVFFRVQHRPDERGYAVVHIFHFDGERIVELWDVGQEIPAESVNQNGMF